MNPIKIALPLALALAGLSACDKAEAPATVYSADKADLGMPNTVAPGLDNRTNPADENRANPDSVDSSSGYSDRSNTAQRP